MFLYYKSSFKPHIESVLERLGRQCGIVSKLGHYVPRNVILRYYSSNIKPIFQYGLLVYGCASYRTLEPILKMQKKIWFLKYRQSVSEYFDILNILTVHKLYVYQLMKIVLRSLNKLHTDDYLNNLYAFDVTTPSTRRSRNSFLKIPKCRKILEKNSLKYRGTELLNVFIDNGIFGSSFCKLSQSVFTKKVHDFRDSFILSNYDLIT